MAVVFAAVANSLTTSVTVVAGVLLVLYPLIDAVATLIDARTQHGSARQWLLVNAGTSTVATIALGVAATRSVAAVFMVFGVVVPPVPAPTANADLRCVASAPGFAPRQSHSFRTSVFENETA
jgi:hypothetical protein